MTNKTNSMEIKYKSPYSDREELLTAQHGRYANGQRRLVLYSVEDGMPYMTASVALQDTQLEDDEIAIKDYSENEGILRALIRAGIVEPSHGSVRQGFVRIPICRIKNI